MSKKIVAVNASPRKGWNTDTLVTEAAWWLPRQNGISNTLKWGMLTR